MRPTKETLSSTANLTLRRIIEKEPSEKKPATTTTEAAAKFVEALKENDDEKCKAAKAAAHASLLRLSRQVRYGTRGQVPPTKMNTIMLHIYDLISTETIMQFGWGCEFPIGQCFNALNDGLHELETGAYHCGIEVCTVVSVFEQAKPIRSHAIRLTELNTPTVPIPPREPPGSNLYPQALSGI
jgi:hypothetical protein